MPLFRRLSPEQRQRLEGWIQVFLAETAFVGCHGLIVTDPMRLLVAGQACMLTMQQRRYAFSHVHTVVLYPDRFITTHEEVDAAGVVHQPRQVLSGESWDRGQVVLSWEDVLQGAADPADGENVVFHEFAHQLDSEDGATNGAPYLNEQATEWAESLQQAYHRRQNAHDTDDDPIDAYGLTSPAEFFAVATEAFFERPTALAREYPMLFEQLAQFYQLDPRRWRLHAPTEALANQDAQSNVTFSR